MFGRVCNFGHIVRVCKQMFGWLTVRGCLVFRVSADFVVGIVYVVHPENRYSVFGVGPGSGA